MSSDPADNASRDASVPLLDCDQDEEIAAQLAQGVPLAVIASDNGAERSARLGAVLALAASAGLRTRRVGNGLQAPLTLARIAFQLANDGSGSPIGGSDASGGDSLDAPVPRTVLAIEQAETLAPNALSAVRGLANVSLLLVGSRALTEMLDAAGAVLPVAPGSHEVAFVAPAVLPRSTHVVAEEELWPLDDDDVDGEEPFGIAESGREPPLLCAEARPPVSRARRPLVAMAALGLAGCAAVAATVIYTTQARAPRQGLDTAAAASSAPAAGASQATQAAASKSPASAQNAAVNPSADSGEPAPKPADPTSPSPALAATPMVVPAPSAAPAPFARANPQAPTAEPLAQLRREFETFLQQPGQGRPRMSQSQKDALFAQYLDWHSRQADAGDAGTALSPPSGGNRGVTRIVLHVPRGGPSQNSPHVHLLLGLLGELGRVETRIVGEQPDRPSVRYFYAEDAQAARQVAALLDKAEPGWVSRDFTAYRPRPVQGTIEVWSPQG